MPSLPSIASSSNHISNNVSELSVQENDMKPIDLGSTNRLSSPTVTSHPSSQSIIGHAASTKLMDMGKRLLEAAAKGRVEEVRQLVLNSGAPFTSDWLGTTALHMAAQNGHTEIAEILLKGGVNRDARTKLERTALHLAALNGCLEVVDLLLIHGSEINVRDMLKMTPLHWAVERGHVSVARRLLFGGADISAKSKFQLTPIDLAQQSEHHEMIDLFKKWVNENGSVSLSVSNYNDYWTNYSRLLLNNLNCQLNESHKPIEEELGREPLVTDTSALTSHTTILDIDEPCFDLVGWNSFEFEPDVFLTTYDEDENKVEYLKKVVRELKRENRQLRQKVEQLSTTGAQTKQQNSSCL